MISTVFTVAMARDEKKERANQPIRKVPAANKKGIFTAIAAADKGNDGKW